MAHSGRSASARNTSISCRGTSLLARRGSGKTTALANSGLQFPLADRFGKTALRGIGGTRNCDWWFTNEAVLLDTAGRYTTQESEQVQDAGEWLEFINLLRKYRRRQPINGVIITISISDLLSQSAEASRQQAVNLRQRLSELHEQLGIRFPVYVMVTKADLLKGFRASVCGLRQSPARPDLGLYAAVGADQTRRLRSYGQLPAGIFPAATASGCGPSGNHAQRA